MSVGFDNERNETMKTITELIPVNGRQSFYGKAKLVQTESGKYLLSYSTIVAGCVDGDIHRYWNGRSNTTSAHLMSFFSAIGKDMTTAKFYKLPVESSNI